MIVKGLRAISDFESEFQMALTNKKMSPEIETMFMMTANEYSFLSSSMVKELVFFGGNPRRSLSRPWSPRRWTENSSTGGPVNDEDSFSAFTRPLGGDHYKKPRFAGRSLVLKDEFLELLDKIRLTLPPSLRRPMRSSASGRRIHKKGPRGSGENNSLSDPPGRATPFEHYLIREAEEEAERITAKSQRICQRGTGRVKPVCQRRFEQTGDQPDSSSTDYPPCPREFSTEEEHGKKNKLARVLIFCKAGDWRFSAKTFERLF